MQITTEGSVLVLHGDFDVRSTAAVRQALYALLASRSEGPEDLVVDLTDVAFVDLTALKVLAVATREAGRRGQHLVLRGCGPAVRRMLHKSHLIRVVELERAAASA